MLSDRPYVRGDYPRETTSASTWLICAIAGAFVLQFAADFRLFSPAAGLAHQFALSVDGLSAGRLWTPLTFWLLHSTGNLFHVSLVLLGLFLMGRELTDMLGTKRFLAVFAGSILTGALFWIALNWRHGGELIGSTAALYGMVAVFALLQPNREVSFLAFFFFPVTFRLKQLALALLLADTLALVLVNALGQPLPFAYAPSAHLGGMLTGWAYYRLFHAPERRKQRVPRDNPREYALAEAARSSDAKSAAVAQVPGRSPADLRAQVDRILDKINSEGLGALTPGERRILEDAKAQLKRRP